jgi:hypothetical protein
MPSAPRESSTIPAMQPSRGQLIGALAAVQVLAAALAFYLAAQWESAHLNPVSVAGILAVPWLVMSLAFCVLAIADTKIASIPILVVDILAAIWALTWTFREIDPSGPLGLVLTAVLLVGPGIVVRMWMVSPTTSTRAA